MALCMVLLVNCLRLCYYIYRIFFIEEGGALEKRTLVILHGWSGHASSFYNLIQKLESTLGFDVHQINLVDYCSMDDSIVLEDLSDALQHMWVQKGLPTNPGAVDVITHSMGSLVFRQWMVRFYRPGDVPVKRLLMLAPANFGSPLAHMGRAFLGRLMHGLGHVPLLQVGENLLRGLELASPVTYDLAQQDLFNAEAYYNANGVMCTILIGDGNKNGLTSILKEQGSDGVVRASCANLNCSKLQIDLTEMKSPKLSIKVSQVQVAFAIEANENHSSIVGQHGGPTPVCYEHIVKALTIEKEDFSNWCQALSEHTQSVMTTANYCDYQNVVVHVKDQYNHAVKRYQIDFNDLFMGTVANRMTTHPIVVRVHDYSADTSYHNLLVDCGELFSHLDEQSWASLQIKLNPMPSLDNSVAMAGYHMQDGEHGSAISLDRAKIMSYLRPNTTLLLEFLLARTQRDNLLSMHLEKVS